MKITNTLKASPISLDAANKDYKDNVESYIESSCLSIEFSALSAAKNKQDLELKSHKLHKKLGY